jgi:translation elongation factor EF-Tu-like GTPase
VESLKLNEEVEIVGIRPTEKQLLLVSKCSVSFLMKVKLVITWCLLRGTKKEDVERGQVLLNQEQLSLTKNSKLKLIFLLKKKVDVILHSSTVTVHSFTSEQLTLLVL